MVVVKIVNNNTVSSLDESGRKIFLVGRGIGWHAQAGQPVDRSKIEKVFRMDTPGSTDRLKQCQRQLEIANFRRNEMSFLPDSIRVYTALITVPLVGLKPVKS